MSVRATLPWNHGENASEALKRNSIITKEHLRRALSSIEKDSFRYQNNVAKKPWLEGAKWSQQRIWLAQIVRSQSFETLMGLVIMINLVLMVIETNADASCYPDYRNNRADCPTSSAWIEWLYTCNVVLLVIYTAECAARAFVERGLYVCNTWNIIDLFTMLAGWFATLLASIAPGLMVMRILRVARLVRLGRLMISIPELYTLVSGLGSSFKAILFGSVLLVAVIVVWSIVVVEFLHPINVEIEYSECERCPRGFQTVFAASLTLFSQIVAGDQWSSISVPLAEHSPWTAPIMFFMMTTISLGVMNLILAVIVEKAAEARANDKARKKLAKENEREARMVELAMLCDLLDDDNNGHLSLDEMLQGFDTNEKFWKLMQHFDISRSEVEVVFNVLSGGDQEVNYMEFCQQLSAFNKRDPLMIQQLIKFSVMELRSVLKHDIMEALQKQNEMLEDHLELLAHVPSCSQVAEDLKRRRLMREGAKGSRPSTKMPTTQDPARPERAELHVTLVPSLPSLNLDEVGNALEAACRSFQGMEAELEELIGKAEQIPKSVMREASPLVEDVYHVKSEVTPVPSLRQGRSMSTNFSSLESETATKFQDLVADFYSSMQRHREREEQLQMRSREAMTSLNSLMDSWNIVKQDL